VNREGAEVTSAGRAFQTRAPATEKARRPTIASLTAGTQSSSEVEDRSLCRVGMSRPSVFLQCHSLLLLYFRQINDDDDDDFAAKTTSAYLT